MVELSRRPLVLPPVCVETPQGGLTLALQTWAHCLRVQWRTGHPPAVIVPGDGEARVTLRLSPFDWLVLDGSDSREALQGALAAADGRVLTDLSEGLVVLSLAGGAATAVLAAETGLDLLADRLPVGEATRTALARVPIALFHHHTTAWWVVVERPLARFLYDWLSRSLRDLKD